MATILFNKIYPKGSLVKNITVGSTEVKFVKRGDGILFYDILKSDVYNSPTVTLDYSPNTSPASGGTLSPSLSYSQSWYRIGYSGKTYSQTNIKSGASSITYSISGAGASISSTGVVTWANREDTPGEEREATVTVTVTINGELNTATATVYLEANTVSYDNYSDLSGGSFSYSNAGINGGTITPTHTKATLTKREVWKSGYTRTVSATVTSTFSFSSTYNYVSFSNTSTGAITWTSGVHYDGNRHNKVMCTWTGEGNKSKLSDYVTVTLVCDSQTTSYSWKEDPILSVDTAEADSNMSNLPVTCSGIQIKTIKWDSDEAIVSTSDVNVSPSVANLKATTNTSYISYINGNKLSWYPNPTVNTRSVDITATVTANGISTTGAKGTAKQNGVASTTYYITVKMVNNTQAGTDIIVPYSTNMSNASSGTYTLSAAMGGSRTTTLTIKVPNSVTFLNLVRFGISTLLDITRKTATSSTGTTTQCTISNKLYTSLTTSKQNVGTIYINY